MLRWQLKRQLDFQLAFSISHSNALKSLRNTPHIKILPRTLSFKDVLESTPFEDEYVISDLHADDFFMFRYELQTLFKKHIYCDEEG